MCEWDNEGRNIKQQTPGHKSRNKNIYKSRLCANLGMREIIKLAEQNEWEIRLLQTKIYEKNGRKRKSQYNQIYTPTCSDASKLTRVCEFRKLADFLRIFTNFNATQLLKQNSIQKRSDWIGFSSSWIIDKRVCRNVAVFVQFEERVYLIQRRVQKNNETELKFNKT